jgi:hypothetical protein
MGIDREWPPIYPVERRDDRFRDGVEIAHAVNDLNFQQSSRKPSGEIPEGFPVALRAYGAIGAAFVFLSYMNQLRLLPALVLSLGMAGFALGHDLGNPDDPHPHYDWSVKPMEAVQAPEWFFGQAKTVPENQQRAGVGNAPATRPPQAIPFGAFAPLVKVRWDARFLYLFSCSRS